MDASSSLFTVTSSPIKCKFGHYGEAVGVYVNSTAIKCVTPSSPFAPESVPSETVQFQITMNGYEYDTDDEDNSDLQFTFEGSGSNWGLGPVFVLIMMFFVFIGAFLYFT